MALTVTAAHVQDTADLIEMFLEMEEFYGEDDDRETVETNTRRALFGSNPLAYALIARVDEKPAGFAAYTFLWPAVGSTSSLYLKELYVKADCRQQGVGAALMREVEAVAARHDCSRVEWTTDTTNAVARAFYDRRGHIPVTGKVLYRTEL